MDTPFVKQRKTILAFTRTPIEVNKISGLVYVINPDEHPDLVIKWRVTKIPTYIALTDDREIFRRETLESFIEIK